LPGERGEESPAPVRPAEASAARALAEGNEQLHAGNVAEALLRADAAAGLAPHGSNLLADACTLQGQVRLVQGNPQAARMAFNRALEVNPAHYEARLGLAAAFRALHTPARAIPLYLEAVSLTTDDAERGRVRRLVAETYREAGQPDAARRALLVAGAGPVEPGDRFGSLLRSAVPTTLRSWLAVLLVLAAAFFVHDRAGLPAALQLLLGFALLYACAMLWRAVRRSE
jgi:hypothetical protein